MGRSTIPLAIYVEVYGTKKLALHTNEEKNAGSDTWHPTFATLHKVWGLHGSNVKEMKQQRVAGLLKGQVTYRQQWRKTTLFIKTSPGSVVNNTGKEIKDVSTARL